MNAKIILLLLILFIGSGLRAQEWKLAREKEGIKVYTREEPGSPVRSFRGETTYRADPEAILALLVDVENFDEWDPDISEMRVLDRQEGISFTYYLVYDVPWPMTDRDLCVTAEILKNNHTGEIQIVARPMSQLVPETDDRVRIKEYWQRWSILPLPGGEVTLSTEGFTDPGGSVPAWLSNMVVTDSPLEMIAEIKKRTQ